MTPPGFTGAGLDRADHLRLDPERLAALLARGDALLLELDVVDPVLDQDNALSWGPLNEATETLFLGLEDGRPLFAPLVQMEEFGQRAWSVFRILSLMRPRDAAIWGAARSLNEWHNRHGFCSVCGHATAPFRAGWGRKCPNCEAEHFPRVDPVVIMLAEHEGRVLLGRSPHYPPGRYSALAGFVEPGESIEEAVARELFEEAGVVVRDVRYLTSQPWPFPGQLMMACIGRADSDALTLDAELDDAFWCDRAGVEAALAGDPQAPFQAPPPYAIANTLLTRWLDGA
ncbi:NAD(+) diphosphatase [Allosphingosinicella sp.]|uniref:NAD(+) diphosphatase n=1 Tax=Allosphingosinicella sp. TaxID=2823234 RepID=UPI00378493FC